MSDKNKRLPLFGGWIPFIGYRDSVMSTEMAAELGIGPGCLVEGHNDAIYVEVFEVEWFRLGITFWVRAKPRR